MSVKYIRPEVADLKPVYQMIRDVLKGPTAVKSGDYLPVLNPDDKSKENQEVFKAYKKRAIFYDATSRTHQGLIGQIFYRDPIIKLPPLLEVILDSVDGGELTLEQQSKEACGTVLALGHAGLLTDYPDSEGGTTRADQLAGRVRPTIVLYQPDKIINWRWSTVGARRYLSLLVLEETYDAEDDGFESKKGTQWRVFTIEEGILRCQIYQETDKGLEVVKDYYPRMGNGKNWDRIPFSPIGSENNDPLPDRPPLEGMAHLNIGHFRNSADYEDSLHMVGQPTPWASGLTEDWVNEVWKGTLRLGSRGFVSLPQGGAAGLLQASPNTMAKEGMELKERQMVALGAKLVEQQQVQRTATESSAESVVENSVLSTVAKNVSAAYRQALDFSALYANANGEIEFELNTDFEISRMSAQDRQQLLAEWQGGGITWGEYRWNMKRSGVAFEEDDIAKAQIEGDMGSDLDLTDE